MRLTKGVNQLNTSTLLNLFTLVPMEKYGGRPATVVAPELAIHKRLERED